MELADARTLPPAAQEDLRRKALVALDQGRSVGQVAELFGVSRQAVYNWIARRQVGGTRGLAALIRQAKRKGFLIVGRHSVHRAARVRKFLAEQADRIELVFLPPYVPS
jgi:transposase-like protein